MDESRMEDNTARQDIVATRHHGSETFRPIVVKEHAALGFGGLGTCATRASKLF
jgi:hypothetical protein